MRTFGQNDASQTNGPNHHGGPLVFGSDGNLYGATGDLNRSRAEQNNTGAASPTANVDGICRRNTGGSIPSDAVFPAPVSQWHAYGVRNCFGLAFDPLAGRPWDTENGPGSYHEINLVAPPSIVGGTPSWAPTRVIRRACPTWSR